MQRNPKNNPTIVIEQYSRDYSNEEDEAEEKKLKAMLKIGIRVANVKLPKLYSLMKLSVNTRGFFSILTENGEKHLLVLTSIYTARPSHKLTFHVEELFIRAAYKMYKKDPTIIHEHDNIVDIYIQRAFLDLKPCEKGSYARQDCQRFMCEKGRKLKLYDDKFSTIRLIGGKLYWYCADTLHSKADDPRPKNIEIDNERLGLDFNSPDPDLKTWDKVFCLDLDTFLHNLDVIMKPIDLNEIFPSLAPKQADAQPIVTPPRSASFTAPLPSVHERRNAFVLSDRPVRSQSFSGFRNNQTLPQILPPTALKRRRASIIDPDQARIARLTSEFLLVIKTSSDACNDQLNEFIQRICKARQGDIRCCYYSARKQGGFILCKSGETHLLIKEVLQDTFKIYSGFAMSAHENVGMLELTGITEDNFNVIQHRFNDSFNEQMKLVEHRYTDNKAIFIFDTLEHANYASECFLKLKSQSELEAQSPLKRVCPGLK